jgi:two-component system OmpR family response regulator
MGEIGDVGFDLGHGRHDISRSLDLLTASRDAAAMLRVLVVDDDLISLRFLEAALKQLGCVPVAADTCFAALGAATAKPVDLLLLDRNLPDGSGAELLTVLREHGVNCPAIATSAEMTAESESRLHEAGFSACIEKPVSLARLHDVLRPWLLGDCVAKLDDDGALIAIGGDRNALHMLRGMLGRELAALQHDINAEAFDAAALLERLHRLRASCGFCGTPALAAATIAFERALRTIPAGMGTERQEFLARCADTLVLLGSTAPQFS